MVSVSVQNCLPVCLYHLHSHRQWMRVPHARHHLLLSLFFNLTVLCGVRLYLVVPSLCRIIRANNVEHICLCSFAIPIFCGEDLFKSCPLSNWVVCFPTVEFRVFFIYSGYQSFVSSWYANILFYAKAYHFIFLRRYFTEQKSLILIKSNLSVFFFSFVDHTFDIMSKQTLPKARSQSQTQEC